MKPHALHGIYYTNSGMLALWDPQRFASVSDYSGWERELFNDSDIIRQIGAGSLVPININADGAFACEVRVPEGPEQLHLTDRERMYCVATSEPYFFRGASVYVSGIEQIEADPGRVAGRLAIPEDKYSVRIYLIAWKKEPGSTDPNGKPILDALPDFVALFSRITPDAPVFRTAITTFDR